MRKLLKWLLDFIETRFPEKVTVTHALFLDMVHQKDELAERVVTLQQNSRKDNQRIFDLKKDIEDLNVQLSTVRLDAKALLDNFVRISNSADDKVRLLAEAVATIDKSIGALKEGIVKGEIRPVLTERERERQDFINGQMPRNMPSRRELEAAERK